MSLRLVHPLDNPCLCGHAMWLHTDHCIARTQSARIGATRRDDGGACRCGKSLQELTK